MLISIVKKHWILGSLVIAMVPNPFLSLQVLAQSKTFVQPQPHILSQLTAIDYFNRGLAKQKSGDYQGAIADYNQAIKLKPDDAKAYSNRGLVKDELLRLKEMGTTIILSTHRMESVEELCSHIALIKRSKKRLDGSVFDIRKKFRADKYEIESRGTGVAFANSLWGGYELLSNEQHGDNIKALVRLPEGRSTNDLISSLIQNVEIHGFKEVLPGMNDIFISLVKQSDTEKESV
jgi:tetratricopeptide (TPR) repeat protein